MHHHLSVVSLRLSISNHLHHHLLRHGEGARSARFVGDEGSGGMERTGGEVWGGLGWGGCERVRVSARARVRACVCAG